MRNVDSKLLTKNREYIYKKDFVSLMGTSFKELNERLLDITNKFQILELQIKQNRLPRYLAPGNLFLGQFNIVDIVPYKRIFEENLMSQKSVFDPRTRDSRANT